MNLNLIRKDGLSEKLVSTIKYGIKGKRSFKFPDQDVLNKVCFGRIKFLGPKYNLYAWLPSKVKSSQEIRKNLENFFGKEQVEEACTNPCIVHFAGPKPWINTSLSYADEWWEYTRQTPFHEEMKGKSSHRHKITPRHNHVSHRLVLQSKPAPVSPAKGPHRHPIQVKKTAR
jgi:lipopolysaccharide biosynthesis glycosyltransferase